MRCKPSLTPTFLLEYLLSPNMERELQAKVDRGAIMDSLNVKGMVKLRLALPPYPLIESFESVARPLRRRIELLVEQNSRLRQTRDLLLPRLISGVLDVEDLDIEVGELSA